MKQEEVLDESSRDWSLLRRQRLMTDAHGAVTERQSVQPTPLSAPNMQMRSGWYPRETIKNSHTSRFMCLRLPSVGAIRVRTVIKEAKAEDALKRQGMLGYTANPDLDSADFNTNHHLSFLFSPSTRESFF